MLTKDNFAKAIGLAGSTKCYFYRHNETINKTPMQDFHPKLLLIQVGFKHVLVSYYYIIFLTNYLRGIGLKFRILIR
jgi:hypothetical protein